MIKTIVPLPAMPLTNSNHPTLLAVVSHGQPSSDHIRECNITSLFQTSDAQPVFELGLTHKAVDDGRLRASERHSTDLRVVRVEDIYLRVTRAGDRIVGWEVGTKSTTPGAFWNLECDVLIVLVHGASVLRDDVIDGKGDVWICD